ncbi:uncharacterized protein BDZ99DRAFT_524149 [Mytilinidion resinicola]|uniref:Uncharacterized protein n=1 Tax=Mytilinidion resinicola TaxID=574789 RepID=A0A6A6YD09_9PEZI|nr:uncharacterized protein BDZ99DRAFT_524149 [Mytilinidion resinicola]KAF2805904.1 hypothetical protein BDZ99DRAFT_524149 [Mytilinidion resinicola]
MSHSKNFGTEAARYLLRLLHLVLLEDSPQKIATAWGERHRVLQNGHYRTLNVVRFRAEQAEAWQMPKDIDAEAARAILENNTCDDAPVILGSILEDVYGEDTVEVLTLWVYPRLYALRAGVPPSPKRLHTVLRIGTNILDLTGGQFGFKWLWGSERDYREQFEAPGGLEVCVSLPKLWTDMAEDRPRMNVMYAFLRFTLKVGQDRWLKANGETLEGVIMGEDEDKREDLLEKLRVCAEGVWEERGLW